MIALPITETNPCQALGVPDLGREMVLDAGELADGAVDSRSIRVNLSNLCRTGMVSPPRCLRICSIRSNTAAPSWARMTSPNSRPSKRMSSLSSCSLVVACMPEPSRHRWISFGSSLNPYIGTLDNFAPAFNVSFYQWYKNIHSK